MTRQLQIKGGVAVAEWAGVGAPPTPPDETWLFVDVTDRPSARIGDTYNASADTFTPPAPPPNYGLTVDVRAFQLLFTAAERIAIQSAAAASPQVADWARLAELPVPIRLKHPNTLAGLSALVTAGLLTNARKVAISNGEAP